MFARLPLLASVFLGLHGLGTAQDIAIERVEAQPRFNLENDAVTDLSGLTWMGGESFFAVADHPNLLVPLTLKIDRATGGITQGEFGTPLPVRAPVSDFEGVTFVAASKTFYISGESGSGVISFQPGGAAQVQLVPPIFTQTRKNLSLEGITWNETAGCFWIANEEALTPDGPVSGATGTLVRLQKLDAKFRPLAQYAYRTEPTSLRFRGAGNGVADLCLLPDGRLLMLERGFGLAGLQTRVFLVETKGATDVSKLPALVGAEFEPVRKTLLFEEPTGFTNFEGIALGPTLADGGRSLILIADSNSGRVHTFLPLKLHFGENSTKAGRSTTQTRSTPAQ